MPDIDFGIGPNTDTGDRIPAAFVKLQDRVKVLEARLGTPTIATEPGSSMLPATAVIGATDAFDALDLRLTALGAN